MKSFACAALLTLSFVPAIAGAGTTRFSKGPIDPKSPRDLRTTFVAGDFVHALIEVNEPWSELYLNGGGMGIEVMVRVLVDEQELAADWVRILNPLIGKGRYILFDIFPNPKWMTAYVSPDYSLPVTRSGKVYGPVMFAEIFSKLPTGKHKVKVEVSHVGKVHSSGTFEMQGDFSVYSSFVPKYQAIADAARSKAAKR